MAKKPARKSIQSIAVSLYNFVNRFIIEDHDTCIIKSDLYKRYTGYCRSEGIQRPSGLCKLGKCLQEFFPVVDAFYKSGRVKAITLPGSKRTYEIYVGVAYHENESVLDIMESKLYKSQRVDGFFEDASFYAQI